VCCVAETSRLHTWRDTCHTTNLPKLSALRQDLPQCEYHAAQTKYRHWNDIHDCIHILQDHLLETQTTASVAAVLSYITGVEEDFRSTAIKSVRLHGPTMPWGVAQDAQCLVEHTWEHRR